MILENIFTTRRINRVTEVIGLCLAVATIVYVAVGW